MILIYTMFLKQKPQLLISLIKHIEFKTQITQVHHLNFNDSTPTN